MAKSIKTKAPKVKATSKKDDQVGIFTTNPEDTLKIKAIKSDKAPLVQTEVDQEVKEWLAQGGAIQSKYQQLGSNENSKIIRTVIKGMKSRRKVWR